MKGDGRAWFMVSQLARESNRKVGDALEMALNAPRTKRDVIRASGASGYLYGVSTMQHKAP